jgi:acyl-coenzyme A thioesterase PaaI-like protein
VEEHLGGRTGLYRLTVTKEDGTLVALAHGTAYRKKQSLLESQ